MILKHFVLPHYAERFEAVDPADHFLLASEALGKPFLVAGKGETPLFAFDKEVLLLCMRGSIHVEYGRHAKTLGDPSARRLIVQHGEFLTIPPGPVSFTAYDQTWILYFGPLKETSPQPVTLEILKSTQIIKKNALYSLSPLDKERYSRCMTIELVPGNYLGPFTWSHPGLVIVYGGHGEAIIQESRYRITEGCVFSLKFGNICRFRAGVGGLSLAILSHPIFFTQIIETEIDKTEVVM